MTQSQSPKDTLFTYEEVNEMSVQTYGCTQMQRLDKTFAIRIHDYFFHIYVLYLFVQEQCKNSYLVTMNRLIAPNR